MPKFIIKISSEDKSLINNENICCYLANENSAEEVLCQAKKSDKLVLAYGDNAVDICQAKELDGILLSLPIDDDFPKHIKKIRKEVGKKFMGICSPITRHEAMIASEAEPDFVAFEASGAESEAEVLDWYGELFLLQSALFYNKKIPENMLEKTDFLIINTSEYKILVDKIERLD